MVVRTSFIHPEKGFFDVSIQNAPSIDDVVNKLEKMGCKVLTVEEE